MDYHKDIIEKLKNSDKWPHFERPEFLGDLNEIADNSFENNTIEGYLASTLIYHQLTEEFLKRIIDYSNFYIQCSIFPAVYIPEKKDNLMFGTLVQEFKRSVRFEETADFLDNCNQINKVRIRLVHKLSRFPSKQKILKEAKTLKELFDQTAFLFRDIEDQFRESLRQHKKNIEDFEESYLDMKESKNDL